VARYVGQLEAHGYYPLAELAHLGPVRVSKWTTETILLWEHIKEEWARVKRQSGSREQRVTVT
jgi:hypothetical protein